jgi:hypothetical protein
LNPWLPPCERVGGERHANLHLRSSRPSVRGEVRWRDEGELLRGAFGRRTADPIHTIGSEAQGRALPCLRRSCDSVSAVVMGPPWPRLWGGSTPAQDHSTYGPCHMTSAATEVAGWAFLTWFKAGPEGGLRPPSGPATTRWSPGNRPHPHMGGTRVNFQCIGSDRCILSGDHIARRHSAWFKGRFRCQARR